MSADLERRLSIVTSIATLILILLIIALFAYVIVARPSTIIGPQPDPLPTVYTDDEPTWDPNWIPDMPWNEP